MNRTVARRCQEQPGTELFQCPAEPGTLHRAFPQGLIVPTLRRICIWSSRPTLSADSERELAIRVVASKAFEEETLLVVDRRASHPQTEAHRGIESAVGDPWAIYEPARRNGFVGDGHRIANDVMTCRNASERDSSPGVSWHFR